MARAINMELLEQKIRKAEQEVAKAKRTYDTATAELKRLLDKRDAIRSQELIKAVAKSPLSYEEIMAFIKSGSVSSETAEDEQ